MSEPDIYDDWELSLDDSLCFNCENRFSRSLIPLDYEDFGIDIDEFELPEGEELILEQHICLVSKADLEGVITECSHYKKKTGDFLQTKVF